MRNEPKQSGPKGRRMPSGEYLMDAIHSLRGQLNDIKRERLVMGGHADLYHEKKRVEKELAELEAEGFRRIRAAAPKALPHPDERVHYGPPTGSDDYSQHWGVIVQAGPEGPQEVQR